MLEIVTQIIKRHSFMKPFILFFLQNVSFNRSILSNKLSLPALNTGLTLHLDVNFHHTNPTYEEYKELWLDSLFFFYSLLAS